MKLPFAIVTWVDASMGSLHWCEGEIPDAPTKRSNVVESAGFMAHQNNDWVVLVQTISEGWHANSIEIPVGMIKEIKVIQEAHAK